MIVDQHWLPELELGHDTDVGRLSIKFLIRRAVIEGTSGRSVHDVDDKMDNVYP